MLLIADRRRRASGSYRTHLRGANAAGKSRKGRGDEAVLEWPSRARPWYRGMAPHSISDDCPRRRPARCPDISGLALARTIVATFLCTSQRTTLPASGVRIPRLHTSATGLRSTSLISQSRASARNDLRAVALRRMGVGFRKIRE